jgi:hypothetical protein
VFREGTSEKEKEADRRGKQLRQRERKYMEMVLERWVER